MTDPLASFCKRLFLAHYFPRPTGLVTVRALRDRYIVTATVDGVLTRKVYPATEEELADIFNNSTTRIYFNCT